MLPLSLPDLLLVLLLLPLPLPLPELRQPHCRRLHFLRAGSENDKREGDCDQKVQTVPYLFHLLQLTVSKRSQSEKEKRKKEKNLKIKRSV
jgi:hypothetical protein